MEAIKDTYKSIAGPSEGLFKDQGSRFIALAYPVESEEEVKALLEKARKEYHDARHHCVAYRIGHEGAVWRASDDGEPQGTAGQPILSVLRGEDLENVLLVVTRYFGGTLLGTGGLVRAYTQAAKDGVAAAELAEKVPAKRLHIMVGYNHVDGVQYLLRQQGITPESADCAASVTFEVLVRQEDAPSLADAILEKTDGEATVRIGESQYLFV